MTREKSEIPLISKVYLLIYNLLQFCGWSYVLFHSIIYVSSHGINTKGLWELINFPLKVFQTLAILEVVHVIIGIVKSGVLTTAIQVASRLFVLWAICNAVPDARYGNGLPVILTAWCITETIRYSLYFFNILKYAPYFLVYLRYTLFIGLYPLGVLGELLCLFDALPHISESKMFSITFPNRVNFSFNFYYFCILIVLSYIPFFPQLYFHMFAQRKKALGTSKTVKTN